MTKNYKLINNILGWLVGATATAVYILTAEPTASWWDCGEYISTAYKLLVGHPPGAPTFQLLGRIFTMFAADTTQVAFCMNVMSALCSGLTIMFLFWSMTMLGRKLVAKMGGSTPARTIALFGSALVGALTYTFTDTFWFSAVEGEVYAMSSFFTALVFWCILKWDIEYDNQKDNVNPNRWIILIAYLVGLSIGVHLLNLLTVPAIVLVVYFKLSKKATVWGVVQTLGIAAVAASFFFQPSVMILLWVVAVLCFIAAAKHGALKSKAEWGVAISLLGSFLLLGIILYGIIPGIVNFAGKFEIFFVNSIGLPFNSGTVIFFLLIAGIIAYGLYWGYKKDKKNLLAAVYSFLFLLIGYSTFFILVIRSNADPTIDENNPEDAVALLAYLNREQYGSTPLFHGQTYTYNTQRISYKNGTPVYVRDEATKKYRVSDSRENSVPVFDPKDCMLFPRMWDKGHTNEYKNWLNSFYDSDSRADKEQRKEISRDKKPTWARNTKFLRTYQFNYMYFRYFMWNFAGRQNDIQGRGGTADGSWICGIPFIDDIVVGDQSNLPTSMERPGHNTYYLLPLLLGLIGLVFYSIKDGKNSFIVLMLFLMTGLAIAFYLNMYAFQPRERDYAFAASFYAFSIWVGFGVFGIYSLFEKMKNTKLQVAGALLTTLLCIGFVPGIMASENWDDHDRSNRYTALAIAKNYLDSCAPNAILFTLGDNDTFPLWYAQEVEGYRTDVRVCNLSLLSTSWYVDQMKRKAYNSDPLPISLEWEQYKDGTRDVLVLEEAGSQFLDIQQVFDYIAQPQFDLRQPMFLSRDKGYRTDGNAIPASFSLKVDKEKVLANGTVAAKDSALIVDKLEWNLKQNGINQVLKAYIIMMDILAHNNWERPIYYANTTGPEAYFGLEDYFQLEGLAYRLVPIKTPNRGGYETGRINSDILYNNLMNVFSDHTRADRLNNPNAPAKEAYPYLWGGFNDPRVFNCEDNLRLTPMIRVLYQRLADNLIHENRLEDAETVLAMSNKLLPNETFPFVSNYKSNYTLLCIRQLEYYQRINTPTAKSAADEMSIAIAEGLAENLTWYEQLSDKNLKRQMSNIEDDYMTIGHFLTEIDAASRELVQPKFAGVSIDKSAGALISALDSRLRKEIENIYEEQQPLVRSFQNLRNIVDFAQLAGKDAVAQKALQSIESNLQVIEQIDARTGKMFRDFVFNN